MDRCKHDYYCDALAIFCGHSSLTEKDEVTTLTVACQPLNNAWQGAEFEKNGTSGSTLHRLPPIRTDFSYEDHRDYY